eukprot:403373830
MYLNKFIHKRLSKQINTQLLYQNYLLRYFSNTNKSQLVFKDTVYALSTGFGKSAIAVIRLTGDSATDALKLTLPINYNHESYQEESDMKFREIKDKVKPRYAHYRKFYNVFSDQPVNNIIDEGIMLYFKGPNSFTGEDMIEFQIHGGNAVKQQMLSTLSKFPTFRQAEPGEFTKRAYMNGKLDLVKAEGLNDLINAQSEEQLKLSMHQLLGRHSLLYEDLRQQLIRMLAHAEAYIDFEADETNDLLPQVFIDLGKSTELLSKQIEGYLRDANIGETIREGFKISILGPPNAGKSTLMNLLTKRRVAIVSEIPGTTRDLISTNINLFGYNVILTDTAGLRDQTKDSIEKQGIDMAMEESQKSHGVIFLLDIQDLEREELFPDMLVEELRAAIHCIGRITGKVDVEDVLDVLFREFCIGK